MSRIEIRSGDFPSGPVVKNLPCNAEDASSVPDQGTKIPHAKELWARAPQLESLRTTAELSHAAGKMHCSQISE